MSKPSETPIIVLNNAFDGASSKPGRSCYAPGILQKAFTAYYGLNEVNNAGQPALRAWKSPEMPNPNKLSNKVKKGIRNYAEVVQALTSLTSATARAQWEYHAARTLTIGGDHSQGFATVKATLLVQTLRAVLHEEIPIRAKSVSDMLAIMAKLRTLADTGKWLETGIYLDALVAQDMILQRDINNVTGNIILVLVDSHLDFHTPETSPKGSHNFHGMWMMAVCGEKVGDIEKLFGQCITINPKKIYALCIRDAEKNEEKRALKMGIHFKPYEMYDPKKAKIRPSGHKNGVPLKKALEMIFKKNPRSGIIFSFDVDAVDAQYVPGSGTAVGDGTRKNRYGNSPPGPSSKDVCQAIQRIMHRKNLLAADLTESGIVTGSVGNPQSDDMLTLDMTMLFLTKMLDLPLGPVNRIVGEFYYNEVKPYIDTAIKTEKKRHKRKAR